MELAGNVRVRSGEILRCAAVRFRRDGLQYTHLDTAAMIMDNESLYSTIIIIIDILEWPKH